LKRNAPETAIPFGRFPLGLAGGILLWAAMAGAAMAGTTSPQGFWLTEDRDAALIISDCGNQLCGRIVWVEIATDRAAPFLDENNPDPVKQKRRICGLAVLNGFRAAAPDRWTGDVYDPRNGKSYSSNLTALPDGTLRIHAYLALPIFGQTQIWTRVDNLAAKGINDCRTAE
jgi:uncharacterized protein (DUF2147 family)